MAVNKEELRKGGISEIDDRIKKLQDKREKMLAREHLALGKLTRDFAKNGFKDFDKFKTEVASIMTG